MIFFVKTDENSIFSPDSAQKITGNYRQMCGQINLMIFINFS